MVVCAADNQTNVVSQVLFEPNHRPRSFPYCSLLKILVENIIEPFFVVEESAI